MSKTIYFRNFNDTVNSELRNDNTTSQLYQFQVDREGTLAHLEDLGFYNVLAYGAVGDGTTDDSAAVQALADTIDNGKTIFFPGGKVYKINSSIQIDKELSIVGEGSRSRITTANNINIFHFDSGGASYLDHVRFENIGFQRTGTATSGSAIKLNKTFQGRFKNVHTYDFFNNIDLENSVEWCMTDCNFNGYWNAGLWLDNTGADADRSDASISGCFFIPVTRNCLYSIYQQNGGGVKIVNTKFNYGSNGQANYHYYYDGNEATSDLMISNCSFENFILGAIRISSSSIFRKVAITGNQLALGDLSSKYIIINNVDDGTITGNQFHSTQLAATAIEITNADDWTIMNQYTGMSTKLSRVGTTARIYNELENRPTSSAGLASGEWYWNSGVLTKV
jgi:hypothetical protein